MWQWIIPAVLTMAAAVLFSLYWIGSWRSRAGRLPEHAEPEASPQPYLPSEGDNLISNSETLRLDSETPPEIAGEAPAESGAQDEAQAQQALTFEHFLQAQEQPQVLEQPEPPKRRGKRRAPGEGFVCRIHPMQRKDVLPLIIITVVYALVAFFRLGDTTAPESFFHFETGGVSAVTELEQPELIQSIWYYTGIKSGTYTFDTSMDGVNWTELAQGEQSYAEQLRWVELKMTARTARYIRVTSSDNMYLGELAVFNSDGETAALKGKDVSASLADEQDAIPQVSSYMNGSYFDEVYHVRTAYENILGIWPYELSHPPLGKLIIAAGVQLLGLNPFGWRFMGTLFGVLMLPALYVLLKNMFGKTLVASCGTVIFAFDFMHFVQTRIATIDTYGVFFILLMFLFMYRYFAQEPDAPLRKTLLPLFLSGLCFGMGCASKWIVVYGGAGLAVLWLIRQIMRGIYYRKNARSGFGAYFAATVGCSVLFFIVIPVAVYLLAYLPYGSAKGYGFLSSEYLKMVWDNQTFMFGYHSKLVATHPYSSPWWQWILDARPILYYLHYFDDGTKSAFGAFGNPLVWWTGIFAVVAAVINIIKRRSGTALFIIIGYLAQLLPWVFVSRICFIYHYFPSALFLTVAISMMMNDLVERRGKAGKKACLLFTGGTLALFVMFYPALTGMRASTSYTNNWLRWFMGNYPF